MSTHRIITALRCWTFTAIVLAAAAAPVHADPGSTARERATQGLFDAVNANDLATVQAKITEGADINAHDRWGMTPVDIAIDRGHYRIAHLLVSVRNQRREQAAELARRKRETAEAAKRVVPAAAGPVVGSTPKSDSANQPDSISVAAAPAPAAWPSDRPNPFDPSVPAPGTRLAPSSSRN